MYDDIIIQAIFGIKHFISLCVSENAYSNTFDLKIHWNKIHKNQVLQIYVYGNGSLIYLSSKILCKNLHKQWSFLMYVSWNVDSNLLSLNILRYKFNKHEAFNSVCVRSSIFRLHICENSLLQILETCGFTPYVSVDDFLGDLPKKIPCYKFYKHKYFLLYVFVEASVCYFDLKIFRYKLCKC